MQKVEVTRTYTRKASLKVYPCLLYGCDTIAIIQDTNVRVGDRVTAGECPKCRNIVALIVQPHVHLITRELAVQLWNAENNLNELIHNKFLDIIVIKREIYEMRKKKSYWKPRK